MIRMEPSRGRRRACHGSRRGTSFCLLVCLIILLLFPPPCNGGIAGFWKWFKSHYKEAVTKAGPDTFAEFDHVLIDVNQLTHMAARKANDEDHAIKRLLKEIARTLRVLRATKSVVIAFDGPAPLAKIITQRKRRSSEKELSTAVNSLHLSPGTAFMRRAAQAIIDFCRDRVESQETSRPRNIRYFVSGSECPGEGEVKLMDWINTFVDSAEESLVVVGGDADLVLQGLALPNLPDFNVYIPDAKRSGNVVSLRHLVARLEKEFPGQAHHVRNDMVLLLVMSGNDYLPKVRGLTFRNKLMAYSNTKRRPGFHDSFLLDPSTKTFNWDFLHAFYDDLANRTFVQDVSTVINAGPTPAGVLNELAQKKIVPMFTIEYEGAETSWTSRLEIADKVYTSEGPLTSMKAAKHVVCDMALREFVPEIHASYFSQGGGDEEEQEGEGYDDEDEDEEEDDVLINLDDDEEEDEMGDEGEEEEEEEDVIVDWRHEEKFFDEKHYLIGLLWNVHMYVDSYCPDYTFAYRYRFAPSARCLADWIQQALIDNPDLKLEAPVSSVPPLHPALACLAVMPRWGLHLVPENLSSILTDYPRVDGMYNIGAPFSLDVLMEAVADARPDLIRSRHFYWTEIGPRRKGMDVQAWVQGAGLYDGEDDEVMYGKDGRSLASIARRVSATSSPPLRPWAKKPDGGAIAPIAPRVSATTSPPFKPSATKPGSHEPIPVRRWKEKRPFLYQGGGGRGSSEGGGWGKGRSGSSGSGEEKVGGGKGGRGGGEGVKGRGGEGGRGGSTSKGPRTRGGGGGKTKKEEASSSWSGSSDSPSLSDDAEVIIPPPHAATAKAPPLPPLRKPGRPRKTSPSTAAGPSSSTGGVHDLMEGGQVIPPPPSASTSEGEQKTKRGRPRKNPETKALLATGTLVTTLASGWLLPSMARWR